MSVGNFIRRYRWTLGLTIVTGGTIMLLAAGGFQGEDFRLWSVLFMAARLMLYALIARASLFDRTVGPLLRRITGQDDYVDSIRAHRLRIVFWALALETIFVLLPALPGMSL